LTIPSLIFRIHVPLKASPEGVRLLIWAGTHNCIYKGCLHGLFLNISSSLQEISLKQGTGHAYMSEKTLSASSHACPAGYTLDHQKRPIIPLTCSFYPFIAVGCTS